MQEDEAMAEEEESQCVIISGESGAGTPTTARASRWPTTSHPREQALRRLKLPERDAPVPVGAEGLRQGSPPQTAEDVMALEDAIISEFSAWNAANPTAPSPRSCCALWQLCCDEVVRGSRGSPHAARVMANILGVPKDLPPEPAPPPVAPAPPPGGAAAAQTASAHAHAATVAAQTLPTWSIQPHVYLELARLAAANLAVMDVLHATAMLESVILGLVYRVDILGGHVPPTPPEPPTPEAPPMQPGDLVHDIYNELFLMIAAKMAVLGPEDKVRRQWWRGHTPPSPSSLEIVTPPLSWRQKQGGRSPTQASPEPSPSL